eukprot:765069-Hanusia_phi.AAC.5
MRPRGPGGGRPRVIIESSSGRDPAGAPAGNSRVGALTDRRGPKSLNEVILKNALRDWERGSAGRVPSPGPATAGLPLPRIIG